MKINSLISRWFILFIGLFPFLIFGQSEINIISNLNQISAQQPGKYNYWLEMGFNSFGKPVLIPVVLIEGNSKGPTLGLTAAIHGNELNGISIIHRLANSIDPQQLKGRILAIPGLNAIAIQNDDRLFLDSEDLNRIFPGKQNGNRSQQYAYKISMRILTAFDFLIDMHTASFGRSNTMYARADFTYDTLKTLAQLQNPDIILNSAGPSVGSSASESRTMRAEASLKGIPTITVEYGNPQVFQPELIERGYNGIMNTLQWLDMYESGKISTSDNITYCKKSYWLYADQGGFLEVIVNLNQLISGGAKIARLRDAFGNVTKEYFAPEDGIIIGKSTNPVNISGGRIIHLGIIDK